MIRQGYREFIERVAAGRDKTLEEVDAIARGRVWAGSEALALGLVDQMGGLDKSIEAAASHADLGDDYRVSYLEQERDWRTRVLDLLVGSIAARLGDLGVLGSLQGIESGVVGELVEDLSSLDDFGDPNGFYAYCFCEPD
jgi:protease-4